MIGSDHDGEALNAARLADKLVRENGITWFDVVAAPALPGPESGPSDLDRIRRDWRYAAAWTLEHSDDLRPKDIEFLGKIIGYQSRPTDAQLKWLNDLLERALRASDRRWAA
jgi:hypothetical protein